MIRRRWTGVAAIAAVFGTALISGMAIAKPSSLSVPMVYKKSSTDSPVFMDTSEFASAVIRVDKFVDKRKDPAKIGENQEEDAPIPVTTMSDVGEWCGLTTGKLLSDTGFNVSTEKATRVIKGEVLQFWVVETGTYDAVVALKISVHRASDDKLLFQGNFQGVAKRWGRSLKAENYQECVSNSLFDAIQDLKVEQGFQKALQ